jgi:hypothetical protein
MRDTRAYGKSEIFGMNLESRNQGIVAVALRATRALRAGKRLQPEWLPGLQILLRRYPRSFNFYLENPFLGSRFPD